MMSKHCLCITEKNASNILKSAIKSKSRNMNFIEIRLDYLTDFKNIKDVIIELKKQGFTIIATNRKRNEGGQSSFKESERVRSLLECVHAGCDYVDIEISTNKKTRKKIVKESQKSNCKIIASKHFMTRTPTFKELRVTLEEAKSFGQIGKIVTFASSIIDCDRVLNLIDYSLKNNFPLLAFCFGEEWAFTRILALKNGAPFMYCSENKKKASGQMSPDFDEETDIYALIGDPVLGSLSPDIHNLTFKKNRINAKYFAIKVKKTELEFAIKFIKKYEIKGFNITIPHKINIINYLDELSTNVKNIGAVNTVVNKDGSLEGFNTDSIGGVTSLKMAGVDLKNKKVLILGAGGTARAIAFALKEEKIGKLIILNRTHKRALLLSEELENQGMNSVSGSLEEINLFLMDTDVLINCTPVGMKGYNENESVISIEQFHSNLVVMDVVYKPYRTKLLIDAGKASCKIISGLDMLVFQAVESFRIWKNIVPPSDMLKQMVLNKLNIIIIGFMGTGKTIIGKQLSKITGKTFVDLDEIIEKESNMSIKRIFEEKGEKYFRLIESRMLKKICESQNTIISCGGGVVLNDINISEIRKNAIVFLLKAAPEVIIRRVQGEKRPLLNVPKKIEKINELLKSREKAYKLTADFSIDTDNLTPIEVANEIYRVII